MNLLNPLALRNSPRRWRAVRAFTAFALMAVLFSARSVQAEPVRIHQVVQTVSSYQGPADLRLGTIATQDPSGNSKSSSTKNDSDSDGLFDGAVIAPDGSVLPLLQDPQKLGVEIEEAEVEGTICDCGDFFIPGGFPKWPLLFLTAVPLVFINDCDDCDENQQSTPTPTPTPPPPTPTPTPTPEPASLLLFGTSLLAVGAGLRRRYTRARLVDQSKAATGEE